jgi:uncharacterized membrane protein YkoI
MNRTKWTGCCLALIGILVARPATAVEGDDITPAAAKKMVKAMEDTKTTLAAGIKTAEESCKGKAVMAHCEMDKDKLVFGVYCLAGEKLMDIDVDAKTGKVVESKEAGKHEEKGGKKEEEDDDELTPATAKSMVKAMDDAKTTLSAAIKTAEESCKGKCVMTHCELEKDKLVIGSYCQAGEKLMDIDVDAKTGKVVESKEAGKTAEKGEKKDEKKEAPKKP